ncbi:GNAT family N-acetyltransferase [Palleronia sediminis]|uniref:GNAT family N-acetyltransferase n=1 Tax=Palleronia sediminis TaxID=2547833 RepID=A0A4R6A6S5_9RHOB|nr:GNAT family N-acetyltransferase [Palleronia sediminis]TDL78427.1 GNAT family N-acetyltransferase [Palleronia sediminis]
MSLIIGRSPDLAACHSVRRAVFIEEQGISEADEIDDLDAGAIHILAQQEGLPIGTARILLDPPVGKIGRICVLAPYRGTGLGRKLVEAALGILRETPRIDEAVLGAQLHTLDFYRKLGFEAEGPIFDDAGIPHRLMRRAL